MAQENAISFAVSRRAPASGSDRTRHSAIDDRDGVIVLFKPLGYDFLAVSLKPNSAWLPFAPRALAGGERAGGMRGLTARKAVFLNR